VRVGVWARTRRARSHLGCRLRSARTPAPLPDAEVAGCESYVLENSPLPFIERIFQAMGVHDGADPYLDTGSAVRRHRHRSRSQKRRGCGLRSVDRRRASRSSVPAWGGPRREGSLHAPPKAFRSRIRALAHPAASGSSSTSTTTRLQSQTWRVLCPGGLVWLTVPHAIPTHAALSTSGLSTAAIRSTSCSALDTGPVCDARTALGALVRLRRARSPGWGGGDPAQCT
jgi:hypothetical protein